jgi:hypothetical protein
VSQGAHRHDRAVTRLALLTAAAIWLVAAGACRPPADRVEDGARRVDVRLLEPRARVGEAIVEVDVRSSTTPVDGARVRVTGDMTHAGMVPVVVDALPLGSGSYRSQGFAFTMSGDWVITVDVVFPDGTRRQVALPVSVGR